MAFGDFIFHGSFTDKDKAKRKERAVNGFIKTAKVKGVTRYIVMTKKRRK